MRRFETSTSGALVLMPFDDPMECSPNDGAAALWHGTKLHILYLTSRARRGGPGRVATPGPQVVRPPAPRAALDGLLRYLAHAWTAPMWIGVGANNVGTGP